MPTTYLFDGSRPQNEYGVTISAGVATHPLDAATAEDLVHAADTALYQAKRTGKNKVCGCGE